MGNRTGRFVVCAGGSATVGAVRSVHRSREAAVQAARRGGGVVETAEVVAMVQRGMSYTDAVQFHAGKTIDAAKVWVS